MKQKNAHEWWLEGTEAACAEPPDYEHALKAFREAKRLSPNDANTRHWLATTLECLERLEEAAKEFRAAINLDPADPRPYIAFGWMLFKQGRLQPAIQLLTQGVELKPHYGEADARLMLALVLLAAGKKKRACQQLEIVAGMEPSYPSCNESIEEARQLLKQHRRD